MIQDDQCHIRRLRLQAPEQSLIHRGATLVEDAVHCASLPGRSAGVLCVKRLSLGRFRCLDSSMNLANKIEEQLRELANQAATPGSKEAERAAAVWFQDPFEPCLMLLRRVADGVPATEWYWPSAVQGWAVDMPRTLAMRRIVLGIHQQSAGPVALAKWLSTTATDSQFTRVVDAITEEDGQFLLQTMGVVDGMVADTVCESRASIPPAVARKLRPWPARWSPTDARLRWLAAMTLIADRPSRMASPNLSTSIQQLLQLIVPSHVGPLNGEHPDINRENPDHSPSRGPSDARQGLTDSTVVSREFSRLASPTDLHIPEGGGHQMVTRPPVRESVQPDSLSRPPTTRDGAFSKYCGLLLLIQVLRQLDVHDWLQQHPAYVDLEFPLRVLHDIAERLGCEADDPVLTALEFEDYEVRETADLEFVVPQSWAPLQGIRPIRPISLAFRTWRYAARRWCRRIADIGLHDLVVRDGFVLATKTHVDAFFDINQSDIRIRKVGLDIDPAWTPWIGKIVHFHYTNDQEFQRSNPDKLDPK